LASVSDGFFDELPVSDDCADVVVACSALTPAPGHGGETGLAEMERACRPGGRVVIVWPNNLHWLAAHGYRYVRFEGEMFLEFASHDEAAELVEIFHPHAVGDVRRLGRRRVPYELLGINPPRDLAYKVITR
jgi:SAM-dependent methyltransferase